MADVRMVEGLAQRFRLTILAPSSLNGRITTWWPPNLPDTSQIVLLPGGRLSFLWRAAFWLARSRGYTAAIVLDNLSAALAANLGKLAGGPPTVLQIGRPTLEYIRCKSIEGHWGIRQRAEMLLASLLAAVNERLANGIGCVSDYVSDICRKRNRLVRSIPFYGVDTDVFAPRWSRAEARKMLGLPEDRPVVLYRSRISPEKDPDTFLSAIKQLRQSGRDLTVVYMGGEMDMFAPRAKRLGVEVEIRNAASRAELPVWYVAADVSVQTSHAEGLGLSLVESLACGTPIVVTGVGGLIEAAKDGEAGFIVPPHSPDELAKAVAALLDNPAEAERLARSGREWAKQRYSAVRAFDDWEQLAVDAAARPRVK